MKQEEEAAGGKGYGKGAQGNGADLGDCLLGYTGPLKNGVFALKR